MPATDEDKVQRQASRRDPPAAERAEGRGEGPTEEIGGTSKRGLWPPLPKPDDEDG